MRLSGWQVSSLVLLVFLLVGVMVYVPALNGPFQFDDLRVVLDEKVREEVHVLGPRWLPEASFLWQWQIWGKNTVPYHLFNVGVHVISAWLVFVLLTQILDHRSQIIDEQGKKISRIYHPSSVIFWLAVFGGGVFLLHPLQTQSVAYISQRFESMMGMWYLASVVTYLKARKYSIYNDYKNYKHYIWYGVSLLAALAALSSKEVAITLPVVLVVMEMVLGYKSYNSYKDYKYYIPLVLFFLLALKVPVQIIGSADLGGTSPTLGDVRNQLAAVEKPADFGMTRANYLWTQFGVVVTYMRMLLVPYGQSIDHHVPLVQSFWSPQAFVPALVLLGILVASVWLWRRGERLVVLGVWWWFVTLSVTSSVIPIRDAMYEHRLYLPMVGFVMVLVSLAYKFYNRYKNYKSYITVGSTTLLAVYFVLTLFRSGVWASEVKLWGDAWKKGPHKDRTNKNYGFVLTEAGRLQEGIERLEYAVKLNPEDQDYRITLGAAYLRVQAWEKAQIQFEKATKLPPDDSPTPWNNLGVALFQLGNYKDSLEAFEAALEREPKFQAAWLGIGGAKLMNGDAEGGQEAFLRAIELEPGDPRSWANLVTLYIQTKQWPQAAEAVKELERLDPKYMGLGERKLQILKNLP